RADPRRPRGVSPPERRQPGRHAAWRSGRSRTRRPLVRGGRQPVRPPRRSAQEPTAGSATGAPWLTGSVTVNVEPCPIALSPRPAPPLAEPRARGPPQPDPLALPPPPPRLPELLEPPRLVLRRDPHPRVGDRPLDRPVEPPRRDGHAAALAGELDGVGQQVEQ